MEHKMVTIPFDLETAKKIRKGERLGQIVAEKGRNRAEKESVDKITEFVDTILKS